MTFEELVSNAGPCDLILVEGYKREHYPKIEVRREGARYLAPLSGDCPGIVAIASDQPMNETDELPIFHIDDIERIVDFIVATSGMGRPCQQS